MRTQKTFLAWENELGSDMILSNKVIEQDKNMYVSRYFGDWKKGVEKVLKFFPHVSFEDTATTTTTATIGGVVVDLPGPDREKRTLATLFFWLEMYIFNRLGKVSMFHIIVGDPAQPCTGCNTSTSKRHTRPISFKASQTLFSLRPGAYHR